MISLNMRYLVKLIETGCRLGLSRAAQGWEQVEKATLFLLLF